MKFRTFKTSDYSSENSKEIEINSLEELIKFKKECGCDIIISDCNVIEIYDTFREKEYDTLMD